MVGNPKRSPTEKIGIKRQKTASLHASAGFESRVLRELFTTQRVISPRDKPPRDKTPDYNDHPPDTSEKYTAPPRGN